MINSLKFVVVFATCQYISTTKRSNILDYDGLWSQSVSSVKLRSKSAFTVRERPIAELTLREMGQRKSFFFLYGSAGWWSVFEPNRDTGGGEAIRSRKNENV